MLSEAAREFYRHKLEEHPEGAEACGFDLEASQRVRFGLVQEIVNVGYPDEISLLDVGCGTGDLPNYLAEEGVPVGRYLGVDLMPEMIRRCHERFDGDGGWAGHKFMQGDIAEMTEMSDLFDYSVAVATFCIKDPEEHQNEVLGQVGRTVRAMADRTRKAMLVTVLSTWKNNIQPDELVVDPTVLWSWAKANLSERVDLIHSYAPHDFALVVRFEKSDWRQAWEAR